MTIGLDRWLRLVAASAFPVLFHNPRPRLGRMPLSARDLADLNLPDDVRAGLEARGSIDALRRRCFR